MILTPLRRRRGFLSGGLALLALPALAQDTGLVTTPSRHDVPTTLRLFGNAVLGAGWRVFTQIDHAGAARDVGLSLPPRSVILFGNPEAGTGAMAAHPTLALDLPQRALVWQDEAGQVFVTRSTGQDIARRVFARHGVDISAEQQAATEAFLARLVRQATE